MERCWYQRLWLRQAALPPKAEESQAKGVVVDWWVDVLGEFPSACVFGCG